MDLSLTPDVAELPLRSSQAKRDVSYIFQHTSHPRDSAQRRAKSVVFANKTFGFAKKTFGFAVVHLFIKGRLLYVCVCVCVCMYVRHRANGSFD